MTVKDLGPSATTKEGQYNYVIANTANYIKLKLLCCIIKTIFKARSVPFFRSQYYRSLMLGIAFFVLEFMTRLELSNESIPL